MRKMGIALLVGVCLLAASPVFATDGNEDGSWWDAVVEWVVSVVASESGEEDKAGSKEPDGLEGNNQEVGGELEPNG